VLEICYMKGIVFSEFMEMAESRYSARVVDEIITSVDLPSGGMYTAVGTYDHAEMLTLVTRLSEVTGVPAAELVRAFGTYLFGRFHELYPGFFEGVDGTFDFLSRIEDHVHAEVRKLYPDAELPTFETWRPDANSLEVVYRSRRPFAALALGLIEGCAAHYQEPMEIEQEELSNDGRTHVRFLLRRCDDHAG
jgi:hypothetical protein